MGNSVVQAEFRALGHCASDTCEKGAKERIFWLWNRRCDLASWRRSGMDHDNNRNSR